MRVRTRALVLAMLSLLWLTPLGSAQATEWLNCELPAETTGINFSAEFVAWDRYRAGVEVSANPGGASASAFELRSFLPPEAHADAFPRYPDPCMFIGLPYGCECKRGVITCIGPRIDAGVGAAPGQVDQDAFLPDYASAIKQAAVSSISNGHRWVLLPVLFAPSPAVSCPDDPCRYMYLAPGCNCECGVITCGGSVVGIVNGFEGVPGVKQLLRGSQFQRDRVRVDH